MKTVLSIAGSDCSGGAGIQADLKTCAALGVFGMSVITSVVAENTQRVLAIQDVSPDMIQRQIDAVFEDMPVGAVKLGMLSSPECMSAVAEKLKQYRPKYIVVDPVMYAKNGCPLMNPHAMDMLIAQVLPLADVLTPNIPEAERITAMQIDSIESMEKAACMIHAMGCKSVIVKGGHAISDTAEDVLYDGTQIYHVTAPRVYTKNTHGTGCTFSSAIAAGLACGLCISDAVQQAKHYVTEAIVHALNIGHGNGPTHHFYRLYQYGSQYMVRHDENERTGVSENL